MPTARLQLDSASLRGVSSQDASDSERGRGAPTHAQPEQRPRVLQLAPEVLTEAVATTSEAYKKMADFLSTHIRVAGAQVIPYSNQLTVLGELFRRIPSPTAPQFVAIEHWFWKTALAGYWTRRRRSLGKTRRSSITSFRRGS